MNIKTPVFEQSSDESRLVGSAAAGMMFAGVVHLAIAPVHWSHSPAHGLFHLLSGLVEIVWAIAFWRRPSTLSLQIGVVIAGALITLWTITRFLPAPFTHEAEEIDLFGIVIKLVEGWGMICLLLLIVFSMSVRQTKTPLWRAVTQSLAIAVVGGGLTYYFAMAVEPLAPWLAGRDTIQDVKQNVVTTTSQSSVGRNVNTDNLQWVVGGIPSAIRNGSPIPVTGDVLIEIMISPGDVRYTRSADLYLHHQTTSKPIEDAKVEAVGSMRFMEHGTFRQVALPSGEGHYYLDLPFIMSGEWQLELKVSLSGQPRTIYIFIDIFN